jgi:cytochrome c peroxidase
MKKTFLVILLAGAMQPGLSSAEPAARADTESAWLAFVNARGEPSLIRGDVDHPSADAIFRSIPDVRAGSLDEDKLQLGFELFREARLSRDGSVACVSCHIDMMGGVDHRPVSTGVGGAQGILNAPTIFNAALNFRQFWDGRALTLREQALGPIENPLEFDHDLDSAVAVLEGISGYVSAFERLYPDGITAANLGDAIAYYETMNFTGLGSPFLGQFQEPQRPLNPKARRGQQRFVEVGCAACHNGVNLGGNSYQQLGVAEPWYGGDRPADDADAGLYGRTAREQDRHVFKVPTLHNVAVTGPWLHDGSVTSLQQAVDRMARFQSGRLLDNSDIDDIVAFLRSLGDRQSLLGDCSASGTYSITMDCSIGPKTSGTSGGGEPFRATLPDPDRLAVQHQQQYSAALASVAAGPERIAAEMQHIRSGQVAHYDFLQYEHIEMLRHARALSHPPASLEPEQRDNMLLKAQQWQQSAEDYELVIADFLRAQAVIHSARANLQDLLRLMSIDADEKTLSLVAQAERQALAFYARPDEATQRALENSIHTLQEVELNPQWLAELQLQVRLLLENIPPPQA